MNNEHITRAQQYQAYEYVFTTTTVVLLLFQRHVTWFQPTVNLHIHVLPEGLAPSDAVLGWLCIMIAAYQVSRNSVQRRYMQNWIVR